MSRVKRKLIAFSLLSGLFSLEVTFLSAPSFANTPAQKLDACIAAINDPLYTRSTIPGLTGYNNATEIETAIGNGSLGIYTATASGVITGSGNASGTGKDFFCGDSNNNSIAVMDSNPSSTRDYFWGGAGNDSVSGTMWGSTFWGGAGDDTVATLDEGSIFYGGDGNDSVATVTGGSSFYGGPGNDTAPSVAAGSTFDQGVDADVTAPTFPSAATFSVAENSTPVGSITTDESATITIDGGEDRLKFSLTRASTTSATLAFLAAPDFEVPTDVGLNNTYIVVFKGVDSSNNAGYETVTVTVTDVVDTSSFSNFTIAGNVISAPYRIAIVLSATVTVASKVTFYDNGRRIAGCISKVATGSGSSYSTTCSWRPTQIGYTSLTSRAVPHSGAISGATSTIMRIFVPKRTPLR